MKKHTMLSEIWRRFKKNKQAIVGLIVLIIFILVAIFAKQIAPYWYDDQDASPRHDRPLRPVSLRYGQSGP